MIVPIFPSVSKRLIIAVLTGAFLLGGGLSYFVNRNAESADTARDSADVAKELAESVRVSQLAACQASLEPGPPMGVRFYLAKQARDRIRETRNTPPEFFPDIPPEQFEQLLRRSVRQQKRAIRQVLAVDCQAQYGR